MKEDGTVVALGQLEDHLAGLDVVPVEGAPVVDVQVIEDVGGLHQSLDLVVDALEAALKGLPGGQRPAALLDGRLDPVVGRAGRETRQHGGEPSDAGADGVLVVVQDDDEAGLGLLDVVQGLEGQSVDERGVAGEGHDVVVLPH